MRQRVLIGWPDGGSNSSMFTKAVLDLQRFELLNPSPDYELIDIDHYSSIYIAENRNQLVKLAKKVKADWLLQLDGDESFKPELLRMLMQTADQEAHPIVVGLYSNIANFHEVGEGSFDVVDCIYAEQPNGAYFNARPPEDLQPFKIDAAGTGVFLTHMRVFDVIEEPWFWLDYIHVKGAEKPQFMNEDLAFCRVAREHGFPIWCVPLAEVTHWKTIPLVPSSLRHFMAMKRKAQLEMTGKVEE